MTQGRGPALRVEMGGQSLRIVYRHDQRLVDSGKRDRAGRPTKVPVPFEATGYDGHRARLARAVTRCVILGRPIGLEGEAAAAAQRVVGREGISICSASEETFNREHARQQALARVLPTLPSYEMAARLLGAYMSSGHRTLVGLTGKIAGIEGLDGKDGDVEPYSLRELLETLREQREPDASA